MNKEKELKDKELTQLVEDPTTPPDPELDEGGLPKPRPRP